MKKLVPALCILLLGITLLGSASFAWFSLNGVVKTEGMNVTTRVASSIMVAEVNDDSQFNPGLVQMRAATLQPISSINGSAFYYTVNAVATGAKNTGNYVPYSETTALSNTDAGKAQFDAEFNNAYKVRTPVSTSNVVYGFVDYVFYLKATNPGESAEALNLTRCNLLYNDNPIGVGNGESGLALRVAVFSQPAEQNTEKSGDGNLITVLKLHDAYNFTLNKAVKNETSIDTVTNANAYAVIDSEVAAGSTEYFKVVVRLWVEGEDTSCNNKTYVTLTEAWSVDLKFEFGGSPVNELGSSLLP